MFLVIFQLSHDKLYGSLRPLNVIGRAVITGWGPGISSGFHAYKPRYFHRKTEDKYKKEIPSCLIPHLLVVFTQQLEILVKTLNWCVLICLLSKLSLLF